jgi:hypothetical protein
MTNVPLSPRHPERTCWGCDKLCPAHDLACGNGTIRTLHPVELFGEEWPELFGIRSGDDAGDTRARREDPAVHARHAGG